MSCVDSSLPSFHLPSLLTRRSSDLGSVPDRDGLRHRDARLRGEALQRLGLARPVHHRPDELAGEPDRKSTRLNSSHLVISYAVFCLKKTNIYSLVTCR